MAVRTLSLILSLWEFFSAFALPRTAGSRASAWVVGLLAAVASVAGMQAVPRARFAVTALAAWLLVAALALPSGSALAFRDDLVVSLAMLALSLVPGTMYPPLRRRAEA